MLKLLYLSGLGQASDISVGAGLYRPGLKLILTFPKPQQRADTGANACLHNR